MQIEIKFKKGEEIFHLIDGILRRAVIQYIHRIYNPGEKEQQILYCIADESVTYIKDELDIYASKEEAQEKIFQCV